MVTGALAASMSQRVGERMPHLPRHLIDRLVPPLTAIWTSPELRADVLVDGVQAALGARAGASTPSAAQLFALCRALRAVWAAAGGAGASDLGPGTVARAHLIVDAALGFIADAFVHEEALLAHSRAHFALIIDAIPQLVWRTTVTGEATFANRRFLEHVGRRLEDVLGWGWLLCIHPDDRLRVSQEWARCRAADQAVSVAFRVCDREGAYRWFLSLGNPFRDAQGTTVAYYGTWTDFDSHTQVVRALEDAVSARDEFLSMASHELKTPLTALSLRAQMRLRRLRRGTWAGADAARAAAEDVTHIGRMTRLVDDMLDVARLERGGLRFVDESLDVGALVAATVERQSGALEAVGCRPSVASEAGIRGRFDPLRLEQALSNLLVNCARYAAGAEVRVRARRAGPKEGLIEVEDGGPGIASEDHARIFGRFERAAAASEQSGLGLGLHLVKHITEHYGGRVELVSAPGAGSIFRLYLPLTAGP